MTFDAGQHRDHAAPEAWPQLERGAGVGDDLDRPVHVVCAPPVLGDHVTECTLVGCHKARDRSLEERQRMLGEAWDGVGFVGRRDVDHAVLDLFISNGPTASASTTPSPPPSIIAGPPMPMLASGVAMIRSEHPSSAALPAKQRPDAMPTQRHHTGQPRPERECHHVETGDHRLVGVTRPAAAALGEEHDRQAPAIDDLEETVFLAVPHRSLGSGEHGVVVRGDTAQ